MDGSAIIAATAAVLSVWIAIFVYLWRIDAAARALRRELEREREDLNATTPAAEVSRVHEARADEPVERR
ncbi:MAG: CcmD family protein [Chloroflexus sp.]|uniref:CcmD family protein n=1 Tax=Chloroflexus sp. TaxID=1904827 RepID=UPI0021DCA0E9|nr:CcmD family protein [Chloroflexus sp.]GIV91098.1 MAG: CcmD family protein [Chloroflexus sp.]